MKKANKRNIKLVITLFFCVVIFLFIWSLVPTAKECEIYNSTIRLHVIANSNSEKDQSAKLKVRDAVLSYVEDYNCQSKQEAIATIGADKASIEKIAKQTLEKEGISDTVSLKIGEESYPERSYEGFSLPAGEYTSVRIVIGEGEGENWWCVLFPPMCTAQAVEYEEEMISVGLTKDQYQMITGKTEKYEIKFKLLEIASEAFGFDY